MLVKPSFYDFFKCKADKCSDSCCIGWEIDVDNITYKKYCDVKGVFGNELRNAISYDGEYYSFNLDENERCPFLDDNNLCRIYANLGEDCLCDICAEHPRFYNYIGDVEECGIGLCCEKVCELLFDDDYELTFSYDGIADYEASEFIKLQNEFFEIISAEDGDIFGKMKIISDYAAELENRENNIDFSDKEIVKKIVSVFSETEPINDEWSQYIKSLSASVDSLLFEGADNKNYNKLLMYIIYRHLHNAFYDDEYYLWTVFCCVNLVFVLLSNCFDNDVGDTDFNNMIINVKRWSKQIEYSMENIEMIKSAFN